MIDIALVLLKYELQSYLQGRKGWTVNNNTYGVHLQNIACLDCSNLEEKAEGITISLVHIEMENTLKNYHPGKGNYANGRIEKSNASVFTNLYILISAVAKADNYQKSLTWLSYTLNFFQSKNIFSRSNSSEGDIWDGNSLQRDQLTEAQISGFKLILDPFPLKIEQMNNIWSTLGNKQVPNVFFKARMVEFRDTQILGSGPLVATVSSSEIIN